MQNSYRGNLKGNAQYINRDGFVGQNKGGLSNAIKAYKTLETLYKAIPAYYRLHLFNDEEAWREDQNSEVPTMDDYGDYRLRRMKEGEWTCPECGSVVSGSTDVCPQCGYNRNADAVVEGTPSDHSEVDNPNAQEAWEASQLATAQREEMGAQDPDNWTAKNGYKRSFETKSVKPNLKPQ